MLYHWTIALIVSASLGNAMFDDLINELRPETDHHGWPQHSLGTESIPRHAFAPEVRQQLQDEADGRLHAEYHRPFWKQWRALDHPIKSAIVRESYIAEILQHTWHEDEDSIMQHSDAHEAREEIRLRNSKRLWDHQYAVAHPPLHNHDGSVPFLERIPSHLNLEIDGVRRMFRAKAFQYIAKIDALWKARRPGQRFTKREVFGWSQSRPPWDTTAKKAAENYIMAFYGISAMRRNFWAPSAPFL